MIKIFKILLSLSLFSLISGCAHQTIAPRIDFVTQADNGRTIVIENGGTVEIDLPSEDASDASWRLAGTMPPQVTIVGIPRKRLYTDSTGSAGMTTISFRTFHTGKAPIKLELSDGKNAPKRTFEVTLDIQEQKGFFVEDEEKEEKKNEKPTLISKTVAVVNPFDGEKDELDDLDDLSEYKIEGKEEKSPGVINKTLDKLNPFSGDKEKTEGNKEPGVISKTLNTLNPFSDKKEETKSEEVKAADKKEKVEEKQNTPPASSPSKTDVMILD